jgi:hypothetical protein
MKTLKTVLTICIIALSLGTYAQNGKGKEGGNKQRTPQVRAFDQTTEMKKVLNLSKEQFDKIEIINVKYAVLLDSMMKVNKGFSSEMGKKIKPIIEAKEKEIKPILTEEQIKIFEENRKKVGAGKGTSDSKS